MRSLAFLFVLGSTVLLGCDGDSSVTMSVYSSGGQIGPGGKGSGGVSGNGGQAGTGYGGAGGLSNQTLTAPGGTRDLDTTQCIATNGSPCPVSTVYLQCVKGNCAGPLVKCYRADESTQTAVEGDCVSYANCLLACPCNSSRNKCESTCFQKQVLSNVDCQQCLITLSSCLDNSGCPPSAACASN